jgi:translation initiation factor IF-3
MEIKAKIVLLIDEEGNKLGMFPTNAALKMAEAKGLDLKIVREGDEKSPTVAKIYDIEEEKKEAYRREKALKKQRREQRAPDLKKINFKISISEHDLKIKENQIRKFIEDGDEVQIALKLFGREQYVAETVKMAVEKLTTFVNRFLDIADIKKEVSQEGNNIYAVISSKKSD